MRKNKNIHMFLDGFLAVYRPNGVNKSPFGAKKNVKILDEMEHIIDLAYTQTYKRIQDLEYAETVGKDLTLKVKTRLVNNISNSDKVVINNVLYDIIYLDEDRTNQLLYLYLEEVRSI